MNIFKRIINSFKYIRHPTRKEVRDSMAVTMKARSGEIIENIAKNNDLLKRLQERNEHIQKK